VDTLFQRMETPENEPVCIELPINLVIRRSTNLRGESSWDLFGW
jgi:LacI family transcriptional regulator